MFSNSIRKSFNHHNHNNEHSHKSSYPTDFSPPFLFRKMNFLKSSNTHFQKQPYSTPAIETYIDITKEEFLDNLSDITTAELYNLSKQEKKSLRRLKKMKNIVFKPADKNLGVVVLNAKDYLEECLVHLSSATYSKIDSFPDTLLRRQLNNITQKFKSEIINGHGHKLLSFLSPQQTHRIPRFYGLPKIHKQSRSRNNIPPVRPIVSHVNSFLSNSAKFLDHCLQPLAKSYKDYIENSTELIAKLSSLHINEEVTLITMDIVSLYPSIPQMECLNVVFEQMCQHQQLLLFSPNLLIHLLEFNMLNNIFEFGEFTFLQNTGIAMGAAFAPTIANIFISVLLNNLLNHLDTKPLLVARYIDDIFCIWPKRHTISTFVSKINQIHPNIKLTAEISNTNVNFLDITIFKGQLFREKRLLDIRTYQKPRNLFQYLHFNSSHPKSTFSSIIIGECVRYARTNTSLENYQSQISLFKIRLQKRGYPNHFINRYIDRISHQNRNKYINNPKPRMTTPIFKPMFKCPYPPKFNHLKRIVLNHYDLLRNLIELPLFITTKHKTIHNSLVNSKYKPTHEEIIDIHLSCSPHIQPTTNTYIPRTSPHNSTQTIQPRICNHQKCATCRHFNTNQFFKSTTNNTRYRIRQSFSCSSTNIIYLITCRKCRKRYVGKTTRTLRERINHHRSTILTDQNRYLSIHFNFPDHQLDHLTVQIIDSANSPNELKHLKHFWINKLQTIKPKGLNFTDFR